MNSVEDLFRNFGGPSKVGQAIGVSTEHAAAMKRRRSIPSRYWLPLIQAAEARGIAVSLEQIAHLHARSSGSEPEPERAA